MILVPVETEPVEESREYFRTLREQEHFKGFFNGRVKVVEDSESLTAFVGFDMPFIPAWIIGVMILGTAYALDAGLWAYILGGFFILLGIVYSPFFWYHGFIKKGLRKAGYTGTIRRLTSSEANGWLVR